MVSASSYLLFTQASGRALTYQIHWKFFYINCIKLILFVFWTRGCWTRGELCPFCWYVVRNTQGSVSGKIWSSIFRCSCMIDCIWLHDIHQINLLSITNGGWQIFTLCLKNIQDVFDHNNWSDHVSDFKNSYRSAYSWETWLQHILSAPAASNYWHRATL